MAAVKVLVCVDHSETSKKVVQKAGTLLRKAAGDQVTLFHIAEFLPEFLLSERPETGMTSHTLAERWAARAKDDGEALLARSKASIIEAGLTADTVQTKLQLIDCRPESKKVAAALAIIGEMQSGNYDLVVVGRRGASDLSLSLIGGVAEKVLREAHGRSVLVID